MHTCNIGRVGRGSHLGSLAFIDASPCSPPRTITVTLTPSRNAASHVPSSSPKQKTLSLSLSSAGEMDKENANPSSVLDTVPFKHGASVLDAIPSMAVAAASALAAPAGGGCRRWWSDPAGMGPLREGAVHLSGEPLRHLHG